MARGGEPCAFRCGAAQYLLLAQALLRTAAAAPGQEAELVTAQWWLARALVATGGSVLARALSLALALGPGSGRELAAAAALQWAPEKPPEPLQLS